MDVQQRVMLLGLVPCAAATVLLTSYFTIDKIRTLEAAFAESGAATAQRLSSYSDLSLYAGDIEALRRISQNAVLEAGIDSVAISNGNGVYISARRSGPPARQTRSFSAAVRIRPTGALDDVSMDRRDAAADEVGAVHVRVDSGRLYQQELQSALTGLLLGLGTLLAAMSAARSLARGIATPLRKLGETVALIRSGDLAARSRLHRDDEFGRLSIGIDDMAEALARHRCELETRVRLATHEAQQQILQAGKANAAKARFLAAASHDLRQPLHAVGLFVGKLRETASADQQPLVARIDEGLAGMAGLLTALMEISRLDAGVVEPQRAVVAIDRLFGEVQASVDMLAIQHGTRLVFRRRALHVDVDLALCERILCNLVENALRYAAGAAVLVTASRRDDHVRIEVRDDGIGIAPMYHERIFEEFFQLDNPERDRRKGLGLGLAICQRAAHLLGTRIEVASAIGRGSSFAFELPLAAAPAIVATAPAPAALPARGSALVVDDDRSIREGTIGLLEQWGLNTASAGCVDSALPLLQAQPAFDYLLCDLQLREIDDGWRVIEAARRASASTRLLLISGDTAAATLRRARENGVIVLTKPVTPAKLRAALGPVAKPVHP
ncbi:MAG: response regulator [Hydrocarboniphaga sp.]|nr:response regulator [Hydrocarboniphaga sp.]